MHLSTLLRSCHLISESSCQLNTRLVSELVYHRNVHEAQWNPVKRQTRLTLCQKDNRHAQAAECYIDAMTQHGFLEQYGAYIVVKFVARFLELTPSQLSR